VDCKLEITDNDRIQLEDGKRTEIEALDSTDIDISNRRDGIPIWWLVKFTVDNDLWDMPTWKVRRMYVLTSTQHKRCRYVELPEMADICGLPSTFVSHCWAAPWGDLVGALSEEADPTRMVWIDVFSVRQWPGNNADLDFRKVIRRMSSFVLVTSTVPSLLSLDRATLNSHDLRKLPPEARHVISFFRVWCLVELQEALSCPYINVVMKCGSHDFQCGYLRFEHNASMLLGLIWFVDVSKAEATLESDRIRILTELESKGGVRKLNSMVASTMRGAFTISTTVQSVQLQCAACGDPGALQNITHDKEYAVEYMCAAAGGGYENIVELLRETANLSSSVKDKDGWSPLMHAADRGQLQVVKRLLEGTDSHEDEANTKGLRRVHGSFDFAMLLHAPLLLRDINKADIESSILSRTETTAVMLAAARGHVEIVEALMEYGYGRNQTSFIRTTTLCTALSNQDTFAVTALLSIMDTESLNGTNKDGQTPLMVASMNGYLSGVQFLMTKGVKLNMTNSNLESALFYAVRSGQNEIAKLLLERGSFLTKWMLLEAKEQVAEDAGVLLNGGQQQIKRAQYEVIETKICRFLLLSMNVQQMFTDETLRHMRGVLELVVKHCDKWVLSFLSKQCHGKCIGRHRSKLRTFCGPHSDYCEGFNEDGDEPHSPFRLVHIPL
jgi:ankyrin repeat protein